MAVKYSDHNMGRYKIKKNKKIANFNKGQTRGKDKGTTCQASKLERYMTKRNRSWKHKKYGEWCRTYDGKSFPKRVMGGI